jgi:putative FmdB family regulatory protein
MPIYEYRCSSCGIKYEKIVFNPSAAPPPRCPSCGSEQVEKLISAPGACGVPAAGSPFGGSGRGGGGCGSGFS